MGRPAKLGDLVAQRIVNAVKSGLPRTHAARLARISPTTLYRALRLGRGGDPEYAEFAQRVAEAEAHDVEELVGFMREHAKESYQACAWLLERRHPKQFAQKKYEAPEATRPGALLTSNEDQLAQAESIVAALKSAVGT